MTLTEAITLTQWIVTAYLVLGVGLVVWTCAWYHAQEKRRQGRC